MRNKKITIALLIILTISLVGAIGIVSVLAAKTDDSVYPLEKMAAMDLTHENFAKKEPVAPTGGSGSTEPADVGDTFNISVSDDYMGLTYDEEFIVLLEGDHCLILITVDAYESFDGTTYYFLNEYGTWGFDYHEITDAQLVYMRDEFDNTMWPVMTEIYGEPLPRGDEGQKIWIVIFNIIDYAYYSEDAPYYIAGYFSAGTNSDENKNIIHIDTYFWADRVGPGVGRPYLYEGTIAHEFEHLIHYDIDFDEPSWVDEGLADLAGFFCGYGHSSGHIANYLVYHPVTSLTFWGSGLEDYGASYLFQLYLYEKFGGAAFTSDLVAEQANGIEGIEITLAAHGYTETFDEIYNAWTIAVYLDDLEPGGPYGFDTLNIGTEDTWGYSINYVMTHMWFQPNPFVAPIAFGSPWGPVQPYTAHYYPFGSSSPTVTAYLEGDIESGPGPYSGSYAWYSDVGAWAWRAFYQSFNIPLVGETKLKFMAHYDIEDYWDFGYVEVHHSGGWTTLADENGNTMSQDPFQQDNPFTPDGREPRDYLAAGEWNAFTGHSDGWIPIEMDLTPFAGEVIDLYFTTWQDGAFTYQMMYVDDIEITNGVHTLDHCEDPNGWSTRPDYEGGNTWYIYDCIEENNWQATFIETFKEPQKNPTGNRWVPSKNRELVSGPIAMAMSLGESLFFPPTLVQQGFIFNIPASPTRNEHSMVLIVSNRKDHILPAMYYAAFL
ncbi:MAG: hypothetical protein ACFE85_05295 [Candidatus Hodarchaeota archaeon]